MKKSFVFALLLCVSFPLFAEPYIPPISGDKGQAPNLNLTSNPTPAVKKINEAKQAYWEEDYSKACDLWHEALNLHPYHPEGIWHDIGLCSEKQEKYADAIEAFTNALNIKDNPDFYSSRGDMYFKNGDLESAKKDFQKFAKIKGLDSNYFYIHLALMLWKEEKYEEALVFADKGLEVLTGMYRLKMISIKAGLKAILKERDFAIQLLEENQDELNALKDSEEEIEIKDYYKKLLIRLYSVKVGEHIKEDDKSESITYLKKILEVDPEDEKAKKTLCGLFINSGQIDEWQKYCNDSFGYRLGNSIRNLLK